MKMGVLPLPKRRFGGGVTDIVPIRGLVNGGPYYIPDDIAKNGILMLPIVVNTPNLVIDADQACGFLNGVKTHLEKYFRVRVRIPDDFVEKFVKKTSLKISDFSKESVTNLFKELHSLKEDPFALGAYKPKLGNIAVILFTKYTSRKLKFTPYYVTKLVFGDELVSQVITEKALDNQQMSYANIASGIFTKLGGIPWRLNELLPTADIIIGIGRTVVTIRESPEQREVSKSMIGSVAVMRSDGVLKEARATVVKDKEELAKWIARNVRYAIESYILRSLVSEVNASIHYSGKKPSQEEMDAITKQIERIRYDTNVRVNVKIVHITDDIPHRILCKEHNMYPVSGFYWITSERTAFLTPLGATELDNKTYYSFTGIPRTLKVTLVKIIDSGLKPEEALMDSLQEVYSLTFMHLVGMNININEPISTKYSRELAYLTLSLVIIGNRLGIRTPSETEFARLWFL